MKLNELTIVKALKGLKEKKFSAVELTQACLNRIKQVDNKIKAFITVCEKEALEQAKEVDRLIKKEAKIFEKRPLLGMPVALKDLYVTKDIRTTAGSKILENYIPAYNASVVAKYKSAGAIIIGKTNLDAWGHGASGENSDYFPTKNPWDLTCVSGGSSSGSAAAIISDCCLIAGGTDTGGSVRYPAGFCNAVGLKPTYGRVSRRGIIAMASSLDTVAHLTKTVEDSALVLSVTAGKDECDATTPAKNLPNYFNLLKKTSNKKLKIGLPKEYFIKGINKEISRAINEAIIEFKKMGHQVCEVTLPHTKYAVAVYYIIQPSEVSSNLARYDGIRFGSKRVAFGDEAKRRIMLGTYTLSAGYYDAYYLKAMKVRSLIKKDFDKIFEQVDLLLTPISPTPPFKLGEKVDDPLTMYLCDVFMSGPSLAGVPALAIPCGFTKDNLPIGMQIIGPQFSEELLFKVGHGYQQITDYHKRKPNI